MDEKGFTFTPLTFLLIIPVMIIAIAYGNIVDEANSLGSLIIGGDVTYTSATTIIAAMQKGAGDAGRNSAYNASRKVIDDKVFFTSGTSKTYITNNVITALNSHIVNTTLEVERQTGRDIYINDILIDSYSDTPFNSNNVNITQTDPFGFYVNIKGGIPIKIVQKDKDQVFELKIPPLSTYVTITGLEDPYIWIYTKYRSSNVIFSYPHYNYVPSLGMPGGAFYHFDDYDDKNLNIINYLYDCLNGTKNPNSIPKRPYYFPDPNGLSFFDRLEGKNSSNAPSEVRMSTFIIGDPLMEDHGGRKISAIDNEYFRSVSGYYTIKIGGDLMTDPLGSPIYLTRYYAETLFKIQSNYLSRI